MSETPSLQLPLLQPSQAQKHVTVNEALIRIDGLAQLRLQSRSLATPPVGTADGACYAVPAGAGGDWAGRDGTVAIASNGGWVHVAPDTGWRGWVLDESRAVLFAGGSWQVDVIALAANGAASRFAVEAAEHVIVPGGAQEIALDIPANAMVFACSARVIDPITGTLASWSLGLTGETGKFGSGMGLLSGSYCTGILSQPTTYYGAARPLLSPVGGDFAGGRLALALHLYRIDLPG